MPTILSHPVVPIAISLGLGNKTISKPLLAAGIIASMLPDLDVLSFHFGIPYASEWGHRGFSHSLFFAFLMALTLASLAKFIQSSAKKAFYFLFLSMASHGILDAMTNGGLGVAFLWPIRNERFFVPLHPIEVSPIGVSRFLSLKGLEIVQSEIIWLWLPCLTLSALFARFRRFQRQTQ